ncbi:ABC transporter substrate-binding protein, partial [Bradyrhizobium sp.]
PYYQTAFPVRGRDVEKAKALLKEAGVTPPVAVDFMVSKESESEAAAQVLQAMAAEAGFDLKIRITEFATSLKQAEAGEYQAFMLEWSGRSDPDGNAFNHLHSGAALNYSAWSNAAADKALEDARLVSDMAKRKAIYETLVREQQADEPILYLYHRKFLFAQTTRLEGFKPMPDGLLRVVGLKLK